MRIKKRNIHKKKKRNKYKKIVENIFIKTYMHDCADPRS